MKTTKQVIGLRKLREQSGLTQAELAEKAGMSQQAVSDYETSRKNPSLAAAERIATGLDTTVDMVAKAFREQREAPTG